MKKIIETEFKSRRVSELNAGVIIKFELTCPEMDNTLLELEGITQGYNLTGFAALFRLPADLKDKSEIVMKSLCNSSISIRFNFDELKEKNNNYEDAIGSALRVDKPKTIGYDIFCAVEFEYLPAETSLLISKKLREEENMLISSGVSRANFFELKKEA